MYYVANLTGQRQDYEWSLCKPVPSETNNTFSFSLRFIQFNFCGWVIAFSFSSTLSHVDRKRSRANKHNVCAPKQGWCAAVNAQHAVHTRRNPHNTSSALSFDMPFVLKIRQRLANTSRAEWHTPYVDHVWHKCTSNYAEPHVTCSAVFGLWQAAILQRIYTPAPTELSELCFCIPQSHSERFSTEPGFCM